MSEPSQGGRQTVVESIGSTTEGCSFVKAHEEATGTSYKETILAHKEHNVPADFFIPDIVRQSDNETAEDIGVYETQTLKKTKEMIEIDEALHRGEVIGPAAGVSKTFFFKNTWIK